MNELDSLILLVLIIVQGIQLHRFGKRLDTTQHYHSIRLEARIAWLEGKHALSRALDNSAREWTTRQNK